MSAYEAKLLRGWIRELQGTPRAGWALRSFAIGTYASLLGLFVVYFLFERALVGAWLLAAIVWALLTGAALMLTLIQRRGRERLAYLAPHVALASMQARLAQLES